MKILIATTMFIALRRNNLSMFSAFDKDVDNRAAVA